jgi:hypothetical protein
MPDPTTQSNYLQVHTTNVDLDWSLDFENQIVEGTATHTVLAQEAGVEVMYLDPSQLLPPLDRIDITFLQVSTRPILKLARCWWMNARLKYVIPLVHYTNSIYPRSFEVHPWYKT